MYDASNKFTERWISRFVDRGANFDPHGNGSRLAASQQEPTPPNSLRFKFHVSPAAKTTEIKREIENVLGARPLSESIHRVLLLGIINEFPIHEHAPMDEDLLILKADRNAAFVAKFNPFYFVYVGLEDEETCDF